MVRSFRCAVEWKRAKRAGTEPCSESLARSPSASSPIPCRPDSGCAIAIPKFANPERSEINFPNTGSSSSQTDTLPLKSLSDKTTPAIEADHAFAFYQTTFPSMFIAPVPGLLRQAAAAFVIQISRHLHPQPFMGSFLIVMFAPPFTPPFLGSQVNCWRLQCFFLIDPMQLFVSTILLRMPGSGKLHPNAEFYPPCTQAREPQRTGRPKRRAIIGPYYLRQTILGKNAFERPPAFSHVLLPEQYDGQNISTAQISNRQRFDPPPVASTKPTLKIHRPNFIGIFRQG